MAVTYVKRLGGAGWQGASVTTNLTLGDTVAAKDTIIVAISINETSVSTLTCADTKGNTYTLDKEQTQTTLLRTTVFSARVTTQLVPGDIITVTHPSAGRRIISAAQARGLKWAVSPFNVAVSSGGTSNGPNSGLTATPNRPDNFVYGVCGWSGGADGTVTFTPEFNFTQIDNQQNATSTFRAQATAYRIITNGATQSFSGTLSAGTNHTAVCVVYSSKIFDFGSFTLSAFGTQLAQLGGVVLFAETITARGELIVQVGDIDRTRNLGLVSYAPAANMTVVLGTVVAASPPARVATLGKANAGVAVDDTEIIITLTKSVPVGNHVIVSCSFPSSASAVSVADTAASPNTYQLDFDSLNTSGFRRTIVFSARVTSQLVVNDTITITSAVAQGARSVIIGEYTFFAIAGWFDKSAINVNTLGDTDPTSGNSPITSNNDEMILGVLTCGGGTTMTITADSPMTLGDQQRLAGRNLATSHRAVGSIGAYAANWTLEASQVWSAAVLTYKGLASGVPQKQMSVGFAGTGHLTLPNIKASAGFSTSYAPIGSIAPLAVKKKTRIAATSYAPIGSLTATLTVISGSGLSASYAPDGSLSLSGIEATRKIAGSFTATGSMAVALNVDSATNTIFEPSSIIGVGSVLNVVTPSPSLDFVYGVKLIVGVGRVLTPQLVFDHVFIPEPVVGRGLVLSAIPLIVPGPPPPIVGVGTVLPAKAGAWTPELEPSDSVWELVDAE